MPLRLVGLVQPVRCIQLGLGPLLAPSAVISPIVKSLNVVFIRQRITIDFQINHSFVLTFQDINRLQFFWTLLKIIGDTRLQWNAENRTSLDFGWSKIVQFEIQTILLGFRTFFFCMKAKLWYRTEQFSFGSIHKRSNRTIEQTEQPKCLKS